MIYLARAGVAYSYSDFNNNEECIFFCRCKNLKYQRRRGSVLSARVALIKKLVEDKNKRVSFFLTYNVFFSPK